MSVASAALAQQKGWPRGGVTSAEKIQASPLVIDLDGDGMLEIVVPGLDDKLYVYNHDGTTRSGSWPVAMGYSDGTMASPAAGDIDGDGAVDIVVVGDNQFSKSASVKVYEQDGTLLASASFVNNTNASAKATPCVIDCYRYNGSTRHDAQEIVVRDGDGQVQFFKWNGAGIDSQFDGGAYYLTTVADNDLKDRFGGQQITPSVAAIGQSGDVTYLVAASTDGNVYRWSIESTPSDNWDVTQLTTYTDNEAIGLQFFGSPALADLDEDGAREIVIGGSNGLLYVFDGDGDGAQLAGWPQVTTQPIFSSPAVADLDGDGHLEVVIGCNDRAVYVWDRNGDLAAGSPLSTDGLVYGAPILLDIDGQAGLEIVVSSLDGYFYAWDNEGELLPGWPKRMKTPLYSSPSAGDLHQSGRMALIVGGFDGKLFVFDLTDKTYDPAGGWRQFRSGATRQGAQ
jgi:WD40 repeat protein